MTSASLPSGDRPAQLSRLPAAGRPAQSSRWPGDPAGLLGQQSVSRAAPGAHPGPVSPSGDGRTVRRAGRPAARVLSMAGGPLTMARRRGI
ncbi:hypothetical protein DQ392_06770 [Streptomyces reniochalinae]|uniref:Uncharacterized protein n=1 Tax=Streptomyces reniochalinae TaxID=2250578 RepID=A0A367EVM2_9ACTN|nr:hypothetical protein DQ392_06770 [Streptomyces reniochalinae]